MLTAVVHTARRLPTSTGDLFDDFLASMRMDLTVTDYPDRAALDRYMHGSAEVIGLQLLPVLGTVGPREEAAPYAAALGKAFQLTNFLRDVDEDLTAARVYLPADELAAYGVDRDLLTLVPDATGAPTPGCAARWPSSTPSPARSTVSPATASRMLAPWSRPCVATALTLYSEILDRIEAIDFAVFSQRATGRQRPSAAGRRVAGLSARHGSAPATDTGGAA